MKTRSAFSCSHPRLIAALLATAGVAAQAATIAWDTPQNITAASDVSTTGAYWGSWAPYHGGANGYPVNGVAFQGNDDLGLSVSGFAGGGPYFGTHTTPDSDYNTLLNYGTYADGTTASFTLNGNGARPLVVGRQYLVQVWVSDARNLGGGQRNETVSGSGTLIFPADGSGMGQYVIGYFTADAVSQQLDLAANASAQVNLLQVRDVTPPPRVLTWDNGAGSMEWNTVQSNWTGLYWNNDPADAAVFGGAGTGVVTLTEPITANWLAFDAPGYALAGGSLALIGAPGLSNDVDVLVGTPIVSGWLRKLGAGALTVTGDNTYAANTVIEAGTLIIGGAGRLGAGSYAAPIANQGALVCASSADQALSGGISGGGSLVKDGAGTLTLGGANSYSGGTTVSGGVLRAGNNAALGAAGSSIAVRDGTSLDVASANLWNYTQAIEIAGDGAGGIGAIHKSAAGSVNGLELRSIALAGDASIGGVPGARIDIGRGDWGGALATAPIHIDGQGNTLSLVGNVYFGILAGATNLAGLRIGAGAAVAPHANNAFGEAPVILDGGTLTPWGGHTFTNSVTVTANGGFIDNQGYYDTYTGPVQLNGPVQINTIGGGNITMTGDLGGAGALRKIGGYTLFLGGDNSGYSGAVSNEQSHVYFASAGAGSASASWLAQPGCTFAASVANDNPTIQLGALAGGGRLANAADNSVATFSIGALNTDTVFSGPIQNQYGGASNSVAIAKVGTGTLTLSGPNVYTGDTTISGGTLRITSPYLAQGSTVRIVSGATGELAFAGVDVVGGLELDGVGQPAGFYDASSHPAYFAGAGRLLVPPGTWVWDNGDNNYYWDSFSVNWAGQIWTNLANAIFTGSVGAITLQEPIVAGDLNFGTTAENFTGSFTGAALQVVGQLTARGNSANGPGGPVLEFANDVTVVGDVVLSRRNLTISGGAFTASRVRAPDSWAEFKVAGGAVTISNGIDDSVFWQGNTLRVTLTGGELHTPYIRTTQANWTDQDGVLLNGGSLYAMADTNDFIQAYDFGGGGVRNVVYVGPGGANIDSDGHAVTITKALADSGGAGSLTKSGAGTLTLAAVSSFSGGTTVNEGILNLTTQNGGDGAIRGTVTVNPGAELRATGASGAIFGYTGGACINVLNISNALVDSVGGPNHLWNATVNLAGGELRINGGVSDPSGDYYEWGNTTVNADPGATSAVISGRIRIRPDASPTVDFDVDAGPAGTNLLVSAAITEVGPSGIRKRGPGVMLLTGASTYSGSTAADEGTLLVDGSLGGGLVTVAAGATLGGSGVIGGSISNAGVVAPGASPGTLTCSGSYTQEASGTLRIEIGGPVAGTDYDRIEVTGEAVLGGTLEVVFVNGYTGAVGDAFTVISAASLVGDFTATNVPALGGENAWVFEKQGGDFVLAITNLTPPLSGYDAWSNQYGLAAGPTGDSDGDGYPNLLEYATGGNPTNTDEVARLSGYRSNAVLWARFWRNTNATDVALILEGAATVANGTPWDGVATNRLGVWSGPAGLEELGGVTPAPVKVPDEAAARNRFLRLRVTRP